jgi:hypothetical protein
MDSQHVTQAGFEILVSIDPPASDYQVVGATGAQYSACLLLDSEGEREHEAQLNPFPEAVYVCMDGRAVVVLLFKSQQY